MRLRRAVGIVLLLATLPLLTSCLARRRVVTRNGAKARQALKTAQKQDLLQRLGAAYESIKTLNATVDMVPALGSAEKGRITEYKDIRAYILFREPRAIRIIGLYPVVRNKAFDMVSNGETFRLHIPARDAFITGANRIVKPSANKLENLRPQHFLDALLVAPPARGEAVLMANLTDEESAHYVLQFVAQGDGDPELRRSVWFDRTNLELARQILFDERGDILTDARYSDWQTWDGVRFPKQIQINRPRDEYAVVITMVKVDLNKPIPDERFTLEQPEGTKLRVLGE